MHRGRDGPSPPTSLSHDASSLVNLELGATPHRRVPIIPSTSSVVNPESLFSTKVVSRNLGFYGMRLSFHVGGQAPRSAQLRATDRCGEGTEAQALSFSEI